MDWNEFNRQLQNRVSDPGLRYMLGMVYERQLDIAKQLDICASLIGALVETVNNSIALSEIFDGRLKELKDHVEGRESGVSLESVPLTNDEDDFDRSN